MTFKIKCFIQRIISAFPNSGKINYFFQRYVRKSLPRSDEMLLNKAKIAFYHFNRFIQNKGKKIKTEKYLEFGAGWDLIIPFCFLCMGFNVTAIDIKRIVVPELIEATLKKFLNLKDKLQFDFDPEILSCTYNDREIEIYPGMNYYAPMYMQNTDFPDDTFDLITSTATMEHIPEEDLLPILEECYRILKPGGIFSAVIDYQDHWSYFDKSISVYNFLKYSQKEWKKYSPSVMYQNRLRHNEYIDIISKTDFEIKVNESKYPDEKHLSMLRDLKVDDQFSGYTFDELSVCGSDLVLKKPEKK